MEKKQPLRHTTHLIEEMPDVYSRDAKIRIEIWNKNYDMPGTPATYHRDEWFIDPLLAKKLEARFEDGTICSLIDILKEEEGEQVGLDL